MLVQFSFENFRSFRDSVSLSLMASGLASAESYLDTENVFSPTEGVTLLKSAAVYGANGSGKSNLVLAFFGMRKMVLNSSRESQANKLLEIEPFLLRSGTDVAPTTFEVVFYAGGRRYRYGFSFTASEVQEEWLYHVPSQRERLLFLRQGDTYEIATQFKEARGLIERTRKNALLLSVAAQFNGPISKEVFAWFGRARPVSGLHDAIYEDITLRHLESEDTRGRLLSFLSSLDLGIEDVSAERVPINPDTIPKGVPPELREILLRNQPDTVAVRTRHRKYNEAGEVVGVVDFDIEHHESEGTQKLFAVSGALMQSLADGSLLMIDELDARLHPLVTCAIIRLFNSSVSNPNNAQLIFTTHDTNLLNAELLRRDQVYFVEKSKFGASSLYSLAEYRIRKDAPFERDYIAGRYGAVPFLRNVVTVVENNDAGA